MLEAIVDRLEEDKAVLKIARQSLVVPLESLPDETGEGTVLYLSFSAEPAATEDKNALAKAVLNEILKKNDP
ncbi:MAG: DUF3006 family protein [Patescibacteria group bacterium]